MSEERPEDMPDRVPEDMPEHIAEDMPARMPEDMPDRMPEDMPDKMPEDMSDRMPEDLPVTKRINVMVGITRSKVIIEWDMAGPALHQHKTIFGKPQKCIPLGWAATMNYQILSIHGKLRILKCMKHREDYVHLLQ